MNTRQRYILAQLGAVSFSLYEITTGKRSAEDAGLKSLASTLQNVQVELARGTIESPPVPLEELEAAMQQPPQGGITAGDYEPRPEPTRPNGGAQVEFIDNAKRASALADLI